MSEFTISEDFLGKRKHVLMVLPIMMLCLAGFALYVGGYRVSDNSVLIPVGFIFLAAAIFLAVQMPVIFAGMRKISLTIGDDRITKKFGKSEQSASWSDISKVKVIENISGKINFIRLYKKDNKVIYLFGFDDMTKIADLIKSKISSSVLIEEKRHRFDWDDPGIVVAVTIGMMIVLVFLASTGLKAMDVFFAIFFITLGLYSLLYRPLSKGSIRFKLLDVILGILLILVGVSLFLLLHYIF